MSCRSSVSFLVSVSVDLDFFHPYSTYYNKVSKGQRDKGTTGEWENGRMEEWENGRMSEFTTMATMDNGIARK
jgi:hypothetical protein